MVAKNSQSLGGLSPESEEVRPAGRSPAPWPPLSSKFIHLTQAEPLPRLPEATASELSKGGAAEPEALPGAALLRPFYRLGAGEAGGPCCGWRASRGSRQGSAAEAPPHRSWRRGAAARRAPFPRPPRVLGGASGGAPAGPVYPAGRRRRLPGQAQPATARGAAGGGHGEGGAGALPPRPLARSQKAARRGPPCARTRERERAGPRRRRCGSPSLPQWGWAAERAGRGKGQAPPPLWAME